MDNRILQYAQLAANAYSATNIVLPGGLNESYSAANTIPIPVGYTLLAHRDSHDNTSLPDTGFLAAAYENGNEIVISFAGTKFSDLNDWTKANIPAALGLPLADQIVQAAEFYLDIANDPKNLNKCISFTGHSLGGGLASLLAVYFDRSAVVFDNAPFGNSADSLLVVESLRTRLVQDGYAIPAAFAADQYKLAFPPDGTAPSPTRTLREQRVEPYSISGEVLSLAPDVITSYIGTIVALFAAAPELNNQIEEFIRASLNGIGKIGQSPTVVDIGAKFDKDLDWGILGIPDPVDLHSMSLMTAAMASDEFVLASKSHPELLPSIFKNPDYSTSSVTDRPNLLDLLVQRQLLGGKALDVLAGDITQVNLNDGVSSIRNNSLVFDHDYASAILARVTLAGLYEQAKGLQPNELNASSMKAVFALTDNILSFDGRTLGQQAPLLVDDLAQLLKLQSEWRGSGIIDIDSLSKSWYLQSGFGIDGNMRATSDASNINGVVLLGWNGNDHLTGTDSNDIISGGSGSDSIYGLAGDDTLIARDGNDWIFGGDGNDSYLLTQVTRTLNLFSAPPQYDIYDSSGIDTIYLGDGKFTIASTFNLTDLADLRFARVGSDLWIDIAPNPLMVNPEGDDGRIVIHDQGFSGHEIESLALVDKNGSQIGSRVSLVSVWNILHQSVDGTWQRFVSDELVLIPNPTRIRWDAGYQFSDLHESETGATRVLVEDKYSTTVLDHSSTFADIAAALSASSKATAQYYGPEGIWDNILEKFINVNKWISHPGAGASVGTKGDDLMLEGYVGTYDGGAGIDTLYVDVAYTKSDVHLVRGIDFWNIERFYAATGSGNDLIDNRGNGSTTDEVYSGAGNDTVRIDGGTVDTGSGNDIVQVTDGGYGWVKLGAGDDAATIRWGAVDGESGNDTVAVTSIYADTNYTRPQWLVSSSLGADSILASTSNYAQINAALADAQTVVLQYAFPGFNTGNQLSLTSIENISVLAGSDYNDLLFRHGTGMTYNGGAGFDTFYADWSNFSQSISWVNHPEQTQVVADATVSGMERLLLATGSGNDLISNAFVASNDEISTGSGNDTINGGAGDDRIDGGPGLDTAEYRDASGSVTVDLTAGTSSGADGNDTLISIENVRGSEGFGDVLIGDNGNNVLEGLGGDDTLVGGLGNDTLLGGLGVDTLDGGAGDDQLSGDKGNDRLVGGAGNDKLDGGIGNDSLEGGAGDDSYVVDSAGDTVVELAGEGVDSVTAYVSYTLSANVENLALVGTAAVRGTGNTSDNTLLGNALRNTLTGLAGNDLLDGGTGADTMLGGAGDDTYYVDNVGDVTTETAGNGVDTVITAIDWTLASNVENLMLAGTAARSGTGNSLDNTLTGNAIANTLVGGDGSDVLIGNGGNDTLDGGLGADRMLGGTGNDTYVVDNASDQVVELASAGTLDSVQASISYTLPANVERLTLLGAANINAIGNELDNTINGNTSANRLAGGLGKDTLTGESGADQFVFDTALGGSNIDTVTDFVVGSDKIVLSNAVFIGIGVAALSLNANAFAAGAGMNSATSASTRIVFDTISHNLYFDADGVGGVAAVQFAILNGSGLPGLSASSFVVEGAGNGLGISAPLPSAASGKPDLHGMALGSLLSDSALETLLSNARLIPAVDPSLDVDINSRIQMSTSEIYLPVNLSAAQVVVESVLDQDQSISWEQMRHLLPSVGNIQHLIV